MTQAALPSSASSRPQPRITFWVVIGILVIAAVVFTFAVQYLKLYFQKDPVPLPHGPGTLKDEQYGVAREFGTWRLISIFPDEPIDPETEDMLKTKEYIFRIYANSRYIPAQRLDELKGKGASDRRMLLGKLQQEYPQHVVHLSVTYYTGMVDTVAHIPDRCMTAAGFDTSDASNQQWDLGNRLGMARGEPVPLRYMVFDDRGGGTGLQRAVAYTFHVNGTYKGSVEAVRLSLQDLRRKHGYYAKVELMAMRPDSKTPDLMRKFLIDALPSVENCLPDWQAIEEGKGGAKPAGLTAPATAPAMAPTGAR